MAMTHDVYTHGHHEAVLRSHTWRTAENSAGYLLAASILSQDISRTIANPTRSPMLTHLRRSGLYSWYENCGLNP